MVTNKIPRGEMPIVTRDLEEADFQNVDYIEGSNGSLDSYELSRLDPDELIDVFKYGLDESDTISSDYEHQTVSYRHAARAISELRQTDRMFLFRRFGSIDQLDHIDGPRFHSAKIIEALAKQNLNGLVDDLVDAYFRANTFNIPHSNEAKQILPLENVNPEIREKILRRLEKRNPGFARLARANDLSPLEVTHDTILDAYKDAVGDNSYRIFGFGEHHVRTSEPRHATSFEYFSREIVPHLVREQGVRYIGTEILLADENDEIATYMRTGVLDRNTTPQLYWRTMSGKESKGIAKLLQTVRSLRMENDDLDVVLVGLNQGGAIRIEDGAQNITDNSVDLIRRALDAGDHVALYNGSSHNEVDFRRNRHPEDSYISYLPEYADQMFEFDIIVPNYQRPYQGQEHVVDNELVMRSSSNGFILQGEGNSYNVVVPKNAGRSFVE